MFSMLKIIYYCLVEENKHIIKNQSRGVDGLCVVCEEDGSGALLYLPTEDFCNTP
jgi:hypothetical protein